ncbi:hypothetical protein BDR04DRAFT_1157295 [Suillus decipiens]|nr:hypothetical protein BDR04DRAFT_1157295 [Suillus decipiens]
MTTFYMALCCTPAVPFFNGNPADLLMFLIMVDQLADMAGITEEACIKAATWYAHPDEAELWECLEEYDGNSYEEFTNAVLYAYPGHSTKMFKHTVTCTTVTLLADSYEEDTIEYSDADTWHAVITPIIDTEEQMTPTDITATPLIFKIMPMASQDKVPVSVALLLNILLLKLNLANQQNAYPPESAVTITDSASTNEKADITKKQLLKKLLPNVYH